jgi:hypothetical protein
MLCKQLWRAFPNIKEKEPNYRERYRKHQASKTSAIYLDFGTRT